MKQCDVAWNNLLYRWIYCIVEVKLCGTIYHQIYMINCKIHSSINSNLYSFPNNYCSNLLWIYQWYLVKLYCIPSLHCIIKITYVFPQKCNSVSCDSIEICHLFLETIGIPVDSKARRAGCRGNDVSFGLIRDRIPRLYV